MRFQRNAAKRSRPEGLGHPHATKHTAVSYQAKYKQFPPHGFAARLARMLRREASAKA